jgi:CheY-like chemotaxis protein
VRVVVVSPSPAERSALEGLLRDEGHEVRAVAGRAEAVALAATDHPDVIIAEARLPRLDGLALVRELSHLDPPPPTILVCPRSDHLLEQLGVVCLTKPIDLGLLYRHLARLAPRESQVA